MFDFTLYMPIAGTDINPLQLVFLGFTVGVIGGFFGVGGAFIVTPALNVFGFPMAYAIGTDMAHIAGKSIISTVRHRRFGNVDIRLGLLMIAGTAVGIELGSLAVMWLEKIGRIDAVVRTIYVALLFGIGSYMIYECTGGARGRGSSEGTDRRPPALAQKAQRIKIPPVITLRVSGLSISVWIIFGVAAITGFAAGFLGVGGGFIRMPALVYIIGTTTKIAVGTDLFEVMFSGMYGAFTYALKGRVEIVAAMVMLAGAAAGAPLGAFATRHVKGPVIRLCFALTMLIAGISVILKQMAERYRDDYREALNAWARSESGVIGRDDLRQWVHINKGAVNEWLAAQPDFIQGAFAMERAWSNCSGYLMLGASCALSAVIIFFLIRGILSEKTAEPA